MLRFVTTVALVLSWQASSAFGCSCAKVEAPLVELGKSTAVFAGRAVSERIVARKRGEHESLRREFTFEVSRVWKDDVPKQVTVSTRMSGASCGYHFSIGREYIVYALGDRSDLRAHLCTRTKPLGEAVTDLDTLGPGAAPNE